MIQGEHILSTGEIEQSIDFIHKRRLEYRARKEGTPSIYRKEEADRFNYAKLLKHYEELANSAQTKELKSTHQEQVTLFERIISDSFTRTRARAAEEGKKGEIRKALEQEIKILDREIPKKYYVRRIDIFAFGLCNFLLNNRKLPTRDELETSLSIAIGRTTLSICYDFFDLNGKIPARVRGPEPKSSSSFDNLQ